MRTSSVANAETVVLNELINIILFNLVAPAPHHFLNASSAASHGCTHRCMGHLSRAVCVKHLQEICISHQQRTVRHHISLPGEATWTPGNLLTQKCGLANPISNICVTKAQLVANCQYVVLYHKPNCEFLCYKSTIGC